MIVDFEKFIQRNSGRIRSIALRYAKGEEAEDLVQEILVALWKGHRSFKGNSTPETWLYRVALNTAMSNLRKTVRERRPVPQFSAIQQTHDTSASGFSENEILSEFLDSLNEIEASIMMMYLDGLTANDMETVLGIKANAISVRINRLKNKFIESYVN